MRLRKLIFTSFLIYAIFLALKQPAEAVVYKTLPVEPSPIISLPTQPISSVYTNPFTKVPVTQNVLVIIYDDHLNPQKAGNINYYYDPSILNQRLQAALTESSVFQLYKGGSGFILPAANIQFTQIYNNTGPAPIQTSGKFDYNLLVQNYDLCARHNNGEFDEVWVWADRYSGLYEATMIGNSNYVINTNGTPIVKRQCNTAFHVMGFNYESWYDFGEIARWDRANPSNAMPLESFMHRVENTIAYYYGKNTRDSNSGIFYQFDGNSYNELWNGYEWIIYPPDGKGYCGNVHYPPNITIGVSYVWDSHTPIMSDCENWTLDHRYAKKLVSCENWGCHGEGFKKWWLQNMPGMINYMGVGGAPMENWWWIIFKYKPTVSAVSSPIGIQPIDTSSSVD